MIDDIQLLLLGLSQQDCDTFVAIVMYYWLRDISKVDYSPYIASVKALFIVLLVMMIHY